jgi:uncharacterized membrane protein YphA (DoxX/SURF4 family)
MRIPPPAILRLVVPAVLLLAGVGGAHAQGALRLGPANTDTYVAIGNVPKLGLATFTIETWFMRQGAGVPTSTGTGGIASLVPLVTRGAGAGTGTTTTPTGFSASTPRATCWRRTPRRAPAAPRRARITR